MTKYKLSYFPIKGAAELTRLLFALADVEYEDERLTGDSWQEKKPKMPLGAMPVLEVDGVQYCQSAAIERYLARKYKLYGANELEDLTIDEIKETTVDMSKDLGPAFSEKDPEKKKELMTTLLMETFPKFTQLLIKKVEGAKGNILKGEFLFGKKLTIGDLYLYRTMDFYKGFAENLGIDAYKWNWGSEKLEALFNNVEKDKKIAKWLAKRPQTSM